MTVDKFRFTKDDADYTTFPNVLLQGLSNAEALGLYVYFSSLPPSWEFYKEKIRDHFGFGRDKLEKLLNILLAHNLIQIFQERNVKGHFNNWRLHVNNPNTYLSNNNTLLSNNNTLEPLTDFQAPLTDFQGTDRSPANTAPVDLSTPLTCLPFTANQSLVNSSYKRNNTKQTAFKENKQKSFLDKKSVDNSKRHPFAESMDQMASEAKHIAQNEAFKQPPNETRTQWKALMNALRVPK